MYGITDPLAAFCFDRAVTLFGQDVDNEISTATRAAKNEEQATQLATAVLRRRLSGEVVGSGFRDPAKAMSF